MVRDVLNPAYGLLYTELQRVAKSRGFDVIAMTVSEENSVDEQMDALRQLLGMNVHGFIVSTGDLPSRRLEPLLGRVPILRAGRPEPQRLVHAVSYDEDFAGETLATWLIECGHRRIAVIRTRWEISLPEWTRAEAMIRTIRNHGLEPFIVDVGNDSGEELILSLIESRAITAVMCPTDFRQLHYLTVCAQRGIGVPGDVSISGCDGVIPGMDRMGLTTFQLPVRALAEEAVNAMLELVERQETPHKRMPMVSARLRGTLVPGRTVARR